MDERKFPIIAYLDYKDSSDDLRLEFPTSTEKLQTTLKEIGAENGEVNVGFFLTDDSKLCDHLPTELTADSLDELNYLAIVLDEMPESERETFDALVEAGWHCDTMKDIINITENLNQFDIQPAYIAEQYGAFHVNMARDEYADIVERLENSTDSKDRDFFAYFADIESNVDLAAYGRLQAEREDGVFTEQGYLTRMGDFKEVYRDHSDIPMDFRVYTEPEPEQSTANGKRIIESYEVKHAIRLGGSEMIFAENNTADKPYMVCDCSWDNPLSVDVYSNIQTSADYLGAMREFTRRVDARLDSLDLDRVYRGSPLVDFTLTAEDCVPDGMNGDIKGKIVAIKAENLAPEFRSQSYQLALATGGFGCSPDSRGQAVYCTELYSGEQSRWNRSDILGVVSSDTVPAWAHEKLAALENNPPEKESVLAKIRKAMAQPEQPHKPKSQEKSDPEL